MKQFHHFLAFSSCLFKSSALVSGHINPRTILGGALTARGSTRETSVKEFHTSMSIFKAIGQGLTGIGLEKPEYKVVAKEEGYEERKYTTAKWVSTTVQDMSHETARSKGFGRLLKYITGENAAGMKIDMTALVATRIVPGAGPNCESTFTVSFYIPPKHQSDPPAPTSNDVFIEDFPEMTLYASSQGGFMKEEQWLNEARDLSQKLHDKSIRKDFYFTAGYDSPFKLFNRNNEVWFVKE